MITIDQLESLNRVRSAAEVYAAAVLDENLIDVLSTYNELSDAMFAAEGLNLERADVRGLARQAAYRNAAVIASRLRELGRTLHENGSVNRANQIIGETLR